MDYYDDSVIVASSPRRDSRVKLRKKVFLLIFCMLNPS